MKVSLRPLLLASAALLAPQMASATILVAVDDFDPLGAVGAPNNSSNYVAPGFTANISSTNPNASVQGGSTDGTYGPVSLLPTATAETDNGSAWLITNLTTATLSLTAGPNSSVSSLGFLVFDAATSAGNTGAGAGVLQISYQIGAGLPQSLVVPNPIAEIDNINYLTSADYGDYTISLAGISLAANQTISFIFSSAGDSVYLDNIAIVPEPGSLLALGCLMGGGAFFRSRRRRA